MSYAGFSGPLNFRILRSEEQRPINVEILVTNFLPTSESQNNPVKYLGVDIEYKMRPFIGSVISGGPAEIGELRANDKVLSIGNEKILYADQIRSIVSENPNTNLDFQIQRGNEIFYLPVATGSTRKDGVDFGILGVSFGTSRTFIQSLNKGLYETYNLSIKTLQFIGKMLTGNMGTENLSGPIGIAQMAGNTAQAGLLPFMYLMALLSISLAVINLLPIPVLDGGQLTLLGVEAIRGKPLSEKVENLVYTGGAVVVGMLMIFAIFNDISRFI